MKTALFLLAITGFLGSAALQDPPAPPKAPTIVKAKDVKWVDHPSLAGVKTAVQSGDSAKGASVLLMKVSKGTTIPPHWHTSSETVTLVSGTQVFGTGEVVDAAKETELSPGSYILIPSKSPHWVTAKEEFIISIALDKPMDFHLCSEKK